jgi:CheY-like chemotaxis protein
MTDAPIIVVDDDNDDNDILQEAWNNLGFKNPLVFFDSGEKALEYLKTQNVVPFIILSDVNLPKMDGFELKEKLLENAELNYLSVPFIFWSTTASETQIKKSYDLGGNGFFLKGNDFEGIKQSLVDIVNYWKNSKTPS